MEKIRIQKMISDSGYCSRRKAEALIEQGRVRLNGRPVKLGDKCGYKDLITVDGERLYTARKKEYLYIMLNKPRGYVTTVSDELERRTVMDLLDDIEERVYPVGRLDRNSEGLLLLTNDGEFANSI
ncbi:MAG TPA: pseudouridine synthase, partial [Ruminococcus sp.]|nr:pseudouridine synthase [Ruminococcus sp.]